LGTITTIAQIDFICAFDPTTEGLVDPNDPQPPHNSGSIDPVYLDTFEPKLFNVYYWQVNNANGKYGYSLENGDDAFNTTKIEVLKSIAYLNQEFNEYKIFFKYKGVSQLNSPSALTGGNPGNCSQGAIDNFNIFGFSILDICHTGNLSAHAIATDNYDENAINVFVAAGTTNFGGKADYNDFFIGRENIAKGAFVHEMGHVMGLYEMFSNYHTSETTGGVECEHVTRDITASNFNAIPIDVTYQGRGDKILDTNAVPDFHKEWCWNNGINPYISSIECTEALLEDPTRIDYNLVHNTIDNTCYYDGAGLDCEGTQYDISPEDTQNFMAYTIAECRNQFTIGQAIHMHEDIEKYDNKFDDIIELDFSSLYEPYEGEYYLAGPLYPELHTPLFQPGFDYQFVECVGPYSVPAPFGESFTVNSTVQLNAISAFETDYSIITHPNHTAINIIQINQAFGETLYEKCYNNFNKAPKGGRVVRFNDGVFNYNTTTTEKDSTGINTNTLVQDLTPGLYKVEKDYDGGATTQTIIQKNND
jgi:hypothetical protein